MRVGFVHLDRGSEQHGQLAEAMVRSVRLAMPDLEIVQMTDRATACIPGVDRVVRRAPEPLALACLAHYAACEGDWLLLDTDVVVQRDVRNVFDRAFDIAVAERVGTLLPSEVGSAFMARMPYNKGVVFSRSSDFWQCAADRLRTMPAKLQEWMGDQQAMNDIIASGRFMVEVLSNAYNYPPKSRDDHLADKAILHFKGLRKGWMLARSLAVAQ